MGKKEIVIPETRDFKGVWTPRKLYLARNLSMSKKNMLIEIYSLTKNDSRKCFASNKHFSDFLGLKENTIQKMMSDLEKDGYIKRFYQYVGDTKEFESRTIQLTNKFYKEFINEYEESEIKEESHSSGKKSTPSMNEVNEGDGINSTISNTGFKDNSISDKRDSLSTDKDNSKTKVLELHNSPVSEETKQETHVSKTLGRKAHNPKQEPLKDMPTRAREIAERLVDDTETADKVSDCISYFLEQYKAHRHKEHIHLTNDKLHDVVVTMLSTITVEHENDSGMFESDYNPLVADNVGMVDIRFVIDEYFQTNFREKTDYSLVHFTQEGVLTNVMNKCMLGGNPWYQSHSL